MEPDGNEKGVWDVFPKEDLHFLFPALVVHSGTVCESRNYYSTMYNLTASEEKKLTKMLKFGII